MNVFNGIESKVNIYLFIKKTDFSIVFFVLFGFKYSIMHLQASINQSSLFSNKI